MQQRSFWRAEIFVFLFILSVTCTGIAGFFLGRQRGEPEACRSSSERPACLFEEADAALALHRYGLAEEYFQTVLSRQEFRSPDDLQRALWGLARTSLYLGRSTKAE